MSLDEPVRPLSEGIHLIDEPDRFELHFSPRRRRKGVITLGVVGAGLLAGGIPMMTSSILFGFVMLLLGALFLYGAVQQGTNDTVLRIENGRVSVTHDAVGMPEDVHVPVSRIGEVLVHQATGSTSDRDGYSLSLVPRSSDGLEHLSDQTYTVMNVLSRLGVGEDHPAMDALQDNADRPRISVVDQLVDRGEADRLAARIRAALERARDET